MRDTFRCLAAVVFAFSAAAPVTAETELTSGQESALRAIARSESFTWPELEPGQARSIFVKAESYLALYQKHHMPHGLYAEVWWTEYDRSGIHRLEGIGDSACWTGHYLAALALKHHVTKDADTLAAIKDALIRFDVLTEVSGLEGYVARYAGPVDDKAYREYYREYGRGEDPDRPGLGRWAYEGAHPHQRMVWLGNSSRDTYDGIAYGLAAALKYTSDAEVRMRVRLLVERIGDRLRQDDWFIIDGKGHKTSPTPTWQLAWMRLMLAANRNKYAPLQNEYDSLFDRGMAGGAPSEMRGKQDREYYPNNLCFVRLFVLCTLETDPDKAKTCRSAVKSAYEEVADHLNAHFAALYLLLTGDTDSPNARATVQGMLLDFPDPPKFLRAVDNTQNPAVTLRDNEFAEHAHLARERPVTDFMWQRAPALLKGGEDTPLEYPGLDFILPYWIARTAGVVSDY